MNKIVLLLMVLSFNVYSKVPKQFWVTCFSDNAKTVVYTPMISNIQGWVSQNPVIVEVQNLSEQENRDAVLKSTKNFWAATRQLETEEYSDLLCTLDSSETIQWGDGRSSIPARDMAKRKGYKARPLSISDSYSKDWKKNDFENQIRINTENANRKKYKTSTLKIDTP